MVKPSGLLDKYVKYDVDIQEFRSMYVYHSREYSFTLSRKLYKIKSSVQYGSQLNVCLCLFIYFECKYFYK